MRSIACDQYRICRRGGRAGPSSKARTAARDSSREPLSQAPKTRNNPRTTTIHREVTVQPGHRWLGVAAGLLSAGLISGSVCGDAQAQAALTGVVSSSDEGPMEGVLVSAKKDGSSITTTVVSDQQGGDRFPGPRVRAGTS